VWLLLASDRFAKLGYTIAAVAAMGLGVMTKTTFPVFVAGLLAVLLVRGGWRNWKNLLIASGVPLLLALPWLVAHHSQLSGFTNGALQGKGEDIFWYPGHTYPPRWSTQNFTWYGWSLINNTIYLPLALFFATGVGAAIVRFARRRARDDYTPELLVGGFVGYFVVSLFALDDPRYSLPALVYVAVLGTGWIVRSRPVIRYAAATLLAAVVIFNTVTVNLEPVETTVLRPFGGAINPVLPHQFVVAGVGYVEGRPITNGNVLRILDGARAAGARRVAFGGNTNSFFFNNSGLLTLAKVAQLRDGANPNALGPSDLFVYRLPYDQEKRFLPCAFTDDGYGIYVVRGTAARKHFSQSPSYCPI
jgi:hypothetical protein